MIKKQEDFTLLIHGMMTVKNPTSHHKASTSPILRAALLSARHAVRSLPNRIQPLIKNGDFDNKASYHEYDRRHRPPSKPEVAEQYDHIADAITTLPNQPQTHNRSKLLET